MCSKYFVTYLISTASSFMNVILFVTLDFDSIILYVQPYIAILNLLLMYL